MSNFADKHRISVQCLSEWESAAMDVSHSSGEPILVGHVYDDEAAGSEDDFDKQDDDEMNGYEQLGAEEEDANEADDCERHVGSLQTYSTMEPRHLADENQREEAKVAEPLLPPHIPMAQFEAMVDRAVRRLEDDYERTINAQWKEQGDERVDKFLNLLEVRLNTLENVCEAMEQLESFEPIYPSDSLAIRERPAIQVKTIKQEAMSLNFSPPPEFVMDGDWTRKTLEKLSLSENSRSDATSDAWISKLAKKLAQ